MLTDHEKALVANLFKTEWGQAFENWLREEISLLEQKEEYAAKICNEPLHEDFRVQMGIKIGLKRALRKPKECFDELNKQGG